MMLYHRDGTDCPNKVIDMTVERMYGVSTYTREWECPGHQPPDVCQQIIDALPTAKWLQEQLDLCTMSGESSEATALHIWGNLVMALQEKLIAGGAR